MSGIDVGLYKWYVAQIICVCVTIFLIFCANHSYLPIVNHYVTDSTFYEFHAFNFQQEKIQIFFHTFNRFLYSLGPQSFTFYNSILLLASIYLCRIFSIISDKSVTLARASIVFNPYFLISVTGPTKEINLTFLALLGLFLFFNKSIVFKALALMVALYASSVRPEFGIILVGGYMCSLSLKYFKNPIKVCLYIIGLYFILNVFPYTHNLILENSGGEELTSFNMSVYYTLALFLLEMNKDPLLQFVVFAIKVVLGLFAQIARPNAFFSSNIPILDLGYTYLGIFIFPLNLAFVLFFIRLKKMQFVGLDRRIKIMIVYTFAGMFSTIISPMVQFRYLFPYLPLLAALFYLQPLNIRNRILQLTFFLAVVCFIGSAIWLPREYELESTNSLPIFISWL